MALTVVGHWEIGWNAPIQEAPLWAFPLREFGVDDWRMWPVSGIQNREPQVILTEYTDCGAALEGTGQRVFFEPASPQEQVERISLERFQHPTDATYVFGSAHHNPVIQHHREGDSVVVLPTLLDKGVLWPHQVLVAALYDRLVKSWQ